MAKWNDIDSLWNDIEDAWNTLGDPTPVIPTAVPGEIRLLDPAGLLVGIVPAQVSRTQKLEGADTINATIAGSYSRTDGTIEDRWPLIDTAYQILYDGARYIIDNPDTDFEDGGTLQATSAEVELHGYDSNYSPGGSVYLNRTPTQILDALLAGRIGKKVRNPGFGILDNIGKPTNWTHEAGWTSQVVANRRVWQAPAGARAESSSDVIRVTKGVSYSADVFCGIGTATAGTWWIEPHWVDDEGNDTFSGPDGRVIASGEGMITGTAFVAKANKLYLKLITTDSNGTLWFDDVVVYEQGPDTGWTYIGSMDTRSGEVLFNEGTWIKRGVWTNSTDHFYSTAVGDYVEHVFNGSFVGIDFKAGGTGALANIRLNGIIKVTGLSVSTDTTYTISGLDPSESHILEVEVQAVKVGIKRISISGVNLISMRWDYITVMEAVAAVRQAVGGEVQFNTIAKTITHAPTIGRDLYASNVCHFRRGSNLLSFGRTDDRTQIVNRLTGLGYGSGETQLVTVVDSTAVDSNGDTSQDLWGIKRGRIVDKKWMDLATVTAELTRLVNLSCFPKYTYKARIDATTAPLVHVGDTGRFKYKTYNLYLRILEITRKNDGGPADLIIGDTPENLSGIVANTRADISALQKSYQGIPESENVSFSEQFDRDAMGVEIHAVSNFFVPYKSALLELRLRYQIGGLRSYAKAVGGGGDLIVPSGGGSITVSGGGSTTVSGGGSTTESGGGMTNGVLGPGLTATGNATGTEVNAGTSAFITGAGEASVCAGNVGSMAPTYARGTLTITNYTSGICGYTVHAHTNGTGGSLVYGPLQHYIGAGLTLTLAMDWTPYASQNMFWTVSQISGPSFNAHIACELAGYKGHNHNIEHSHNLPDHIHNTPAHWHATPNHTHLTPDHEHVIPDHSHDLSYGIYENPVLPTTIRVSLDGTIITTLNDALVVNDFDALPYIGKDSNGNPQEGWHTLEFYTVTNSMNGAARGTLFVRKFISADVS